MLVSMRRPPGEMAGEVPGDHAVKGAAEHAAKGAAGHAVKGAVKDADEPFGVHAANDAGERAPKHLRGVLGHVAHALSACPLSPSAPCPQACLQPPSDAADFRHPQAHRNAPRQDNGTHIRATSRPFHPCTTNHARGTIDATLTHRRRRPLMYRQMCWHERDCREYENA
jgi:hypothetical protein